MVGFTFARAERCTHFLVLWEPVQCIRRSCRKRQPAYALLVSFELLPPLCWLASLHSLTDHTCPFLSGQGEASRVVHLALGYTRNRPRLAHLHSECQNTLLPLPTDLISYPILTFVRLRRRLRELDMVPRTIRLLP